MLNKLLKSFELYKNKTAISDVHNSLTYENLDCKSNVIACKIDNFINKSGNVALLFDHGANIIISIVGVIRSNNTYVPLNVNYPLERLAYLLSDAEIKLILSDNKSLKIAEKLKRSSQDINIINIDNLDFTNKIQKNKIIINENIPAYILYTSGSTGLPKGVIQSKKNLVYYVDNWIDLFDISSDDKILQITSLSHDGAVQDIFSALFSGATLYPLDIGQINISDLITFLRDNKITIWHSVPSLFRLLVKEVSQSDSLSQLKNILLGGELLRANDVYDFFSKFPNSTLANIYGQTESSVNTVWTISSSESFRDKVFIGNPLKETQLLIIDESGEYIDNLGIGEIVIKSNYLSLGYLNNNIDTKKQFKADIEHGDLFFTGDLGKIDVNGNIEILGRIDDQVKIRGFRIELGEIESQLLQVEGIDESIVVAREDDSGDKVLVAYYVSNKDVEISEIRISLQRVLPDYMIPSFFMKLEAIPLTPNGKVDKRSLPSPDIEVGDDYVGPRNEVEEKLVDIWSEVLNLDKDKISVNANFFELGGHSLKATILASKVHKAFDVQIPLSEIFKNSTVGAISNYIENAERDKYSSIEPAEEKDSYPLSSAQKRLFILQQMDLNNINYNMPGKYVLNLEEYNKEKLEKVFKELIHRHESLRTSFEMIDELPVQIIHNNDEIVFDIEYYEIEGLSAKDSEQADHVFERFAKPFDLSQAPLLRVGFIKTEKSNILLVDMHHIISDGTSHQILTEDFFKLYNGEQLPELHLQYKDYAEWQNSNKHQQKVKIQEEYWLKEYSDELPVLSLPYDYKRPSIQSFEGNSVRFILSKEETIGIKDIVKETDTTLFIFLLSAYNILLSKLSNQENIIVGTPIAGRRHSDLEKIIGMFVNTLAIKNDLEGNKTYKEFLSEVKDNSLNAFENQEYQFEDLVEQVVVNRDASRNPIFDVMFNLLNQVDYDEDLNFSNLELEENTYTHIRGISKFDLNLTAIDFGEQLYFDLEYSRKLFKPETIDRFIEYFKTIINTIIDNPNQRISRIDILTSEEKHQLLYEFNDTYADYPRDKTIQELFEEQVSKTPDNIALVFENKEMSYGELNARSNQLARLLREKGVNPDAIVGIMVDRSFEMIIGILGIMKSGGAYLPIDPTYPEERIKYMLENS
ncbi:MAG: amino acid adenylation domain-containing protein, partial [Candidatus Delongbacteria bacterium]|nr:amino acid adenylation domain-containing protein [Candidatus Delongbacteria bacterium]